MNNKIWLDKEFQDILLQSIYVYLFRQKDFHIHTYIKHICLWVTVYDHVQLTIKSDCNMSSTVLIDLCIFIPLVFK